MKKVLITGGAGFIGYHLACRAVELGWTVDLVDNFSRGVRDPALETLAKSRSLRLFDRNLLDQDSFGELDADYDVIYHLAAILGVQKVLNEPLRVLVDNIQLLVNTLKFAKSQKHLNRFFFASTSEVYAGTLKHFDLPVPTPESTPLALTELSHPRTSYMLSKIYGEALCSHAGLPFTIIRPHNIYGPRMGLSHVVSELLEKFSSGENEPVEVFSPDHSRAFCYVEDAVNIIVGATESSKCLNRTLNVGNGNQEVSIRQAAQVIKEVVKSKCEIAWGPDTPGSPVRRCPDMSLVKDLTGCEAQVSFREGVTRTYEWYREYVFSGEIRSAI